MNPSVTHDREEEIIEAKALWFRSLTLAERMDMSCALIELLLMINPKLVEQRDDQSTRWHIRVLELKGM